MQYRFLGDTGIRISSVALGTMSFGGEADPETAEALFHAALERGVNHFDCADVYNGGRAEELLGRFMAERRDDLVIATKAYFPTGPGPNDRGASRFHLVRAVEASLRRLATDRIDLYYVHRFDDRTRLDETLRALDDLVRQGKILHPALSNFAAWQVARAIGRCELHGWARPIALQPMYNLVKRQAEVEILPMAQALGLGVLPYSPLGGGLLTGKYARELRPPSGRLVDNAMYGVRYAAESNYRVAEAFTELAGEAGVHPVTLAVSWVAAQPGVTAPLLGARNPEQLVPALDAAEFEPSDELLARVSALVAAPPPATDRNEERSAHNYGSR